MHNAALGSVLIWRFSCGYTPQGQSHGTPLPLLFLVLPILLHEATASRVAGTLAGSGLRKFEEKFAAQGAGDVLMSLQPRAVAMRDLTLRSIRVALAGGLVTLVGDRAAVWPRSYSSPPEAQKAIVSLMRGAEKLGEWMQDLTLFEVSGILNVEF